MFDKFTERARKVLNLARREAQKDNSEFIGTEHLLIGIIREGGGVASKVFKNLKVDAGIIIKEVGKLIAPSASSTPVDLTSIPFSPRAKCVMEMAGEAASHLD